MGQLRQAADGHWYERRRTRSGRFYTVQRSSPAGNEVTMLLVLMLVAAPFTFGLTLVLSLPLLLYMALLPLLRSIWRRSRQ